MLMRRVRTPKEHPGGNERIQARARLLPALTRGLHRRSHEIERVDLPFEIIVDLPGYFIQEQKVKKAKPSRRPSYFDGLDISRAIQCYPWC